jgi:hypothetical protein
LIESEDLLVWSVDEMSVVMRRIMVAKELNLYCQD